jgi:hypothetical protein
MLARNRTLGALAAALIFVSACAFGRAKTDVVVLDNGDQITGEIKELYRGKLKISTDAMSTVYIEWPNIKTLSSRYYFEIEDKEGYKYYGTPELTEEGEVRVTRAEAVVTLEKLQVIRITPIEKHFWKRIDGSVSLGVSYTKGSHTGRLDFALDARYRVEKNLLQLQSSANVTAEENKEAIQRSNAQISYQHLFARKVYSDLGVSSYRNDELGIAFRGTIGAGAGAHIIQTNWSLLESTLGLSLNREFPTDPTSPATNNFEGVVSLGYSVFKYDTPKTDFASSASVYPRLPHFDRWRFEVSTSWSQEIVKDFTVVLTLYDDYSSVPPSETAAKNDWGFTTSIGYTF